MSQQAPQQLKLWLLTQSACTGYDTYDSLVVVAPSEGIARAIKPFPELNPLKGSWPYTDKVSAREIGLAAPGLESGQVLCSSFNAG